MSNRNKFFNKKNIDPKNSNITSITAINICDKHLITGDEKGNLITYEFSQNDTLNTIKELNPPFKSKVEKIIVHATRKIAFVLSGGEVYYVKIPLISVAQPLFKAKDIINVFLNKDEPSFENLILILTKRKKLKMYEYSIAQDKIVVNEKKLKKDLSLEDIPKCAIWTKGNYLVYSLSSEDGQKGTSNWLSLDKETKKFDDFPGVVEITSLGEKVAVSNNMYSLYMIEGVSYQLSMLLHPTNDFLGCTEFKNHLFCLYKKHIGVFKAGQREYEPVETISLDDTETGKYIVASKYKLVIISESGKKLHFIEFKEKPYEEQIKILLDQKQYDKSLEKLIENIPEDDKERQTKVEEVFLDCAWACLEGDKKDYDNSIKYITLTNFNPFEFIYMFYETLYVKIIHSDKEKEIKDRKKENQFFGLSAGEEEQRSAFQYLIKILKIKRDYILEKIVKASKSAEVDTQKIKFSSSKRSKINLSESKIDITIRDTFYAINSTLIKSMIKLKADPKEIEAVLDNETINNCNFDDFEKDEFFKDEKNRNLDETKFTLSYITEKKGADYQKALEQWEIFGRSNNKKYSLIGKDRTKKIFYKFKENKNTEREEKERLFRKHIQWLLEKYQNEAFEVVIKTELVSNKIFLEDIIQEFNNKRTDGKKEDLKEKFLEYCNQNQRTENYQSQLLQLYADKMFKLAPKDSEDVKIEGEIKKYYDLFMKIIESEDSVYNKKAILEYIDKSWLFKPRIFLFSQLKEHDKALNQLFDLIKNKEKKEEISFKEIEEFCQNNLESHHQIFQDFYKLLSGEVKNHQDIIDKKLIEIQEKKNEIDNNKSFISQKEKLEEDIKNLEAEIKKEEENKEPYEKQMFKILKEHGKIDEMNPINALEFANDHWNVCENNDFFNYLMNVVKEYTVSGNKYKITKNLSEIGLVYKEKEAYEYKKKYVTIDSDKACDLCKKKIGSTIFVIYPNLRVYHSKCAPNINIDPMTGIDFSKKKYVE